MEEKINILIYEKEIKLNQILKEQICKLNTYEVYEIIDEKKLLELFELIKAHVLILNLNDLNKNLKNIIENYKLSKKINSILGYYNKNDLYLRLNEKHVIILEKPFKIIDLINNLEKLLNTKIFDKSNILLMKHLKFLPYEKVLVNLKTQQKEHLTEKENKLLFYLYDNKNIEITKNDLLKAIWGVSESLNTHTLETHLYRLKQKLSKIEPKISLILLKQNGIYDMRLESNIS
jgi:DNA-binding response OmpR family regulator